MSETEGKKPATNAKNSSEPNSGEENAVEPVLIKKYPNRRLYNTALSAYIVQDDIINLVKSGTPFVIEDTKTGEDITRSILNQIIFEQETKPSDYHFPLEFQKQLISMYGDSYSKMVPGYLTESLKLFSAQRNEMAEAFDRTFGQNTRAMMEMSQSMARQNMEIFRRSMAQSMKLFSGFNPLLDTEDSASPSTETGKSSQESGDRKDTLDELQAKIDALQDQLKSMK